MRHLRRIYLRALLALLPVTLLPPAAAAQRAAEPVPQKAVAEDTPSSETAVEGRRLESALGMQVRTKTEEIRGRIVDVLADRQGNVEAAVIEFGGFLGIGTRKVAVEWSALKFDTDAKPPVAILGATRDQLQATPEYKPGQSMVLFRTGPASPASTEAPPEAAAEPPQSPVRNPDGHLSKRKRSRH